MNMTGGTAGNKTVRSRSPCVITSQMFTLKHYSKKQIVFQYTLHCRAHVLTQMQIKYFMKHMFVRIVTSAIICRDFSSHRHI